MLRDIIACNWTLPNYGDLAEQQKENLACYGIECINLTDSIVDDDRQLRMYKNRSAYFATKDRAQLDFVKSCRGRYRKVLCLDAEVRCHSKLPNKWIDEDRSRIWFYSSGFTPLVGNMKTVNIGEIIWRPEDADVFQLAIDKAKILDQGYDIEFTIANSFHDLDRPVGTEKINVNRFRHRLCLDNFINLCDRRGDFIDLDVLVGEIDGKIGISIDGVGASCTNGWIDDGVIFTHPSIFPEKLKKDGKLKSIYIDDMIGAFAPNDHYLALSVYDWLMQYPSMHESNLIRLRNIHGLRSKGSLIKNMPEMMNHTEFKQRHLVSEVYEIDGWKICPELNLVGLPGKWSTNILVYDTGRSSNPLWSGIQDIVDRTSH